MKTYTYGTAPRDVIEKALPQKYPMELTKLDMLTILAALGEHYEDDNAYSLRTGILETIGIEEI